MILLPEDSRLSKIFDLQPFTTEDGISFYSYRYWVALGVLANGLLTYSAEKYIVNVLTRNADAKKKLRKELAFNTEMEGYRTQVSGMEHMLTDPDEDTIGLSSLPVDFLRSVRNSIVEKLQVEVSKRMLVSTDKSSAVSAYSINNTEEKEHLLS